MVRRNLLAALASLLFIAGGNIARAQAPPSPVTAAEKHSSDLLATWINARFEELWKEASVEQKETVDDATYLRRAYLDLVGKIPSVAQARDFLENPAGDKRNRRNSCDVLRGEHVRHLLVSAAHSMRAAVWGKVRRAVSAYHVI